MAFVELAEVGKEGLLLGGSHTPGVLEVKDRRTLGAEDRALVAGRHVAAGPVFGPTDRAAGGIKHHDETGQILVDCAEPVIEPGSHGRAPAADGAGVHHEHGRAMDRGISGHGVEEGNVVHTAPDVGEEVGYHFPTLAIGLEFPFRADHAAFVLFPAAAKGLHVDGLAVEGVQVRLVIKGVHVARAAVHKEEDDVLCLGLEVAVLRGKWAFQFVQAGSSIDLWGEEAVFGEHPGQGHCREAAANIAQEFAPGSLSTEVLDGFGWSGHGI